ncbi:MAG: ATP-binding protein [Bacteroidota bacterium]
MKYFILIISCFLILKSKASASYLKIGSPFESELKSLYAEGDFIHLEQICNDFIKKHQGENTIDLGWSHLYLSKLALEKLDYQQAQECVKKAISIFEKSNQSQGIIASLHTAGEIELYSPEERLLFLEKAWNLATQKNELYSIFEVGQSLVNQYSNELGFNRSMLILQTSLDASLKLDENDKIKSIYNQISTNFHSIGEIDSSIYFLQELLNFKHQRNDTLDIINDLSVIGNLHFEMGEYVKAQDYLFQALKRAELARDTFTLMSLYTDISKVYGAQQNWKKALTNAELGTQMAQAKNIQFIEAENLKNAGFILEQLKNKEVAIKRYLAALDLFKELNNTLKIAEIELKLSTLYQDINNIGDARKYLQEALHNREKIDDKLGIVQAKLLLGKLEFQEGNYSLTEGYMNDCVNMAKEMEHRQSLLEAHLLLAKVLEARGQYNQAYHHLQQHHAIKDSLLQLELIREVNKIDEQFKTEKKDKEIAQQRAELQEQKTEIQARQYQNTILVASLLILGLAVSLLFVYFNNRKRISDQHINFLTKEKEAEKLKAVLQGEEKERKRIAQELHDGLGAVLATAKMQIDIVQHQIPSIKENESYHKAEMLIDQACQSIRQISHNMMPSVLEQNHIEDALGQVCDIFAHSYDIKVDYIPFGLESMAIKKETSITLYRITQELLKNVAKHAEATEVLVQITADNGHINLTIEDNGKGFNPDHLQQQNGIGLENIKSRVQYLNGSLEIDSRLGEGSSFNIDIPLV